MKGDGRDDILRGIDEELRFHLEERIEALVAVGWSRERAEAQALEEFGDVASVRDGLERIDRRTARKRRWREAMMVAVQEWRQSVRRLARSPGFALAVVLTLGLGLGAGTVVWSLLDRVTLRPLPYPGADRLVWLRNDVPGIGPASWGWAEGQFLYVESRMRSFDAMGLYRVTSLALARPGVDGSEYGSVALVSAGVQAVLGAGVSIGRGIRPDENRAGATPVVLVTDAYWRRRLGSDPGVVGTVLNLDGVPHEVVGVLSPDALLPEELQYASTFGVDVWVPMHLDPADAPRNHHVFRGVARLAPGVDAEQAMAELAALTPRYPEDMPTAYSDRFMSESGFSPRFEPLKSVVVGGSGRVLWILFGAVGLLLAIACANVANLFLVRLEARRRETVVRSVLGASRFAIVRQYLAESMTLALVAGGAGLAMAAAGIGMLRRTSPRGLPRVTELGAGWSEVLFALALAVAIGLLFGLVPAWRTPSSRTLSEGGRASTATRGRLRARHALVALQVALCFVLLAGSGLLVRSFTALTRVDPGFDPAGVLTFRVVLPAEAYPDFETAGGFYRRLAERLAEVAPVESVGMVASLPLGGDDGCTSVSIDVPDSDGACIRVTYASPGYFEAAGIPMRGRDASWTGISGGRRVAVISEALARRLFPGEDPIGRSIRAAATEEWHTIVGIAGDVSEGDLSDSPSELLYLPILPAQEGLGTPRNMAVLVRTGLADPVTLLPAVRSALADVDPRVPLTRAGAMQDLVSRSMSGLRFLSSLLLASAAMALLIATVGIYGVIAYGVSRRRTEIGIRVALGARRSQVRSLILGQSVATAAAGLVLGFLFALPLAGTLRTYLFGVAATDPLTLAAVALFLLAVAGLAAHVPARQALRVAPVEALRPD